jgi:hypothetical protein
VPDQETDVAELQLRDEHLDLSVREDYMKQEEQEHQIEEAVRNYTEELIDADSLRLADRVPLLLHILTQGADTPLVCAAQNELRGSAGCTKQLLQVLSIKALGSLMSLSSRVAQLHSHILADIFRNFCTLETSYASEGTEGRRASKRNERDEDVHELLSNDCVKISSPTKDRNLPLVLEAMDIAEELILGCPNMNGWLLQKLESFILGLLDHVQHWKEVHEAHGSRHLEGPKLVILKALDYSVASFSRMLTANKLQILSSTYSLLGCIMLAPFSMVSTRGR